jgi:hypothetical protein
MTTTNESREALREELKTLEKRAYSLKTKKARIKAWEAVRVVKCNLSNEFHELAEQYEGRVVQFVVLCADSDGKTLMYNDTLGLKEWAHNCNDVRSKSWYPEYSCIVYEKGQTVMATLSVTASSDGLDFSLTKIHGGRVDTELYKELCKNKNRAFFKYPNAKGVQKREAILTGLFAA